MGFPVPLKTIFFCIEKTLIGIFWSGLLVCIDYAFLESKRKNVVSAKPFDVQFVGGILH